MKTALSVSLCLLSVYVACILCIHAVEIIQRFVNAFCSMRPSYLLYSWLSPAQPTMLNLDLAN